MILFKNYLDTIRAYDGRQTHWCPGNPAVDNLLQPSPNKFGSFNIQVFGQTKYKKDVVKDNIIKILQRYDISTIQVSHYWVLIKPFKNKEIRDSAETAFPNLVADMNAISGDIYGHAVGARQG